MTRALYAAMSDFNPRSPCGERLRRTVAVIIFFRFQSTLPLRRATDKASNDWTILKFQSTLPLRRATAAHAASLGHQ